MSRNLRLVDQWLEMGEHELTLIRIYRVRHPQPAGHPPVPADTVRVAVHHEPSERRSHADAFALSAGRTWTTLVSAPTPDWWKPARTPGDLMTVAGELAERACKVLS